MPGAGTGAITTCGTEYGATAYGYGGAPTKTSCACAPVAPTVNIATTPAHVFIPANIFHLLITRCRRFFSEPLVKAEASPTCLHFRSRGGVRASPAKARIRPERGQIEAMVADANSRIRKSSNLAATAPITEVQAAARNRRSVPKGDKVRCGKFASYSITSSASAISLSGIVMPNVLAVAALTLTQISLPERQATRRRWPL
jgi:hypothetical protein